MELPTELPAGPVARTPCGPASAGPIQGSSLTFSSRLFKRMMNRQALTQQPQSSRGSEVGSIEGDPALDWEKWLHLSQLGSFLPLYHSGERWHSLLPWGQGVADNGAFAFH